MNKPNNKRKKNSQEKIESIFIELIQTKEINEISITDICQKVNLNRSTFYANYIDIYDLADTICKHLENKVATLYEEERDNQYNSNDYLKLLKHIQNNQKLYKTYFKLNKHNNYIIKEYDTNLSKVIYNDKYIDYHIAFFQAGFNAILEKWIYNDCKESPEEIYQIIIDEYKKK